ncbi:hypothetical protein, partial [Enterobacter hormaechei]|uniref:hypothetical protein n=1 Tax=Enterobacter hormaechei TaxID=158836 RepID=UPI003525556C
HHAFSSGAGRTSDGNGSHASTLKSPSYTKSVSWQHYHENDFNRMLSNKGISPGDFGRLSYAQCVTEKLIKREGTTCFY